MAFSVVLTLTQTATENVYTWTNPDSYILDFVCADDDPIVPLSSYSSVRSSIPASLLTLSYTRPAGAPYYALRLVSTDQFSNTVGPADNVASGAHAVDAVAASWTFALPQPRVATAYAVDAAGVAWAFALPEPSVTHTAAAATVPSAPTGLVATVTHDTVSLTWDDPGDATIISYQILRRDITGGGSLGVHIDSAPAGTSYVDSTNVASSNSYSYRIKARNAQGLSTQSAFRNVTTSAAPLTPINHAVDAGDASWTFGLPEPTITHTPRVMTTDHAVDAVAVSWAFALPEPSVTHTARVVPSQYADVSALVTAGSPTISAKAVSEFFPVMDASTDLLISQWVNSPRLVALIEIYLTVIKEGIEEPAIKLLGLQRFDIANGAFLDYLGDRIGLKRPSVEAATRSARVGFDLSGSAFDQAPFVDAKLGDLEEREPAGDALYRRLLEARAIMLLSDGSAPLYLKALQAIDPAASLVDNHDMTATITTALEDDVTLARETGALQDPLGVEVAYA